MGVRMAGVGMTGPVTEGAEPSSGVIAALVVPSPPMQLPEYVGAADPAAAIRERSAAALADLLARHPKAQVVVVSGRERGARHTKGSVGERVGRLLLAQVGWAGSVKSVDLPFDARLDEIEAAVAAVESVASAGVGTASATVLIIPADLSAKRTEKAPGHLDPRAAAVDDGVLAALASGDDAALRSLDAGLCGDLWLTGWAALQVLARCLPQPGLARVVWSGDPYGVLYVLARWGR